MHKSLAPAPSDQSRWDRDAGIRSLRAAPGVQSHRGGPRCPGWTVAVAGEHPAPRGTRVRGLAHRPPVGADGGALLPEVRGVRPRGAGGGGQGRPAPSDAPHPWRRPTRPSEYRVRLGALHLGPASPRALWAQVRRVLLPPDHSEERARGDLALLQLRRPVPLSARVQPVCLPEACPPPGTPCWVTGWGSLHPGEPLPDWRPLQGVRVPLLDSRTCDRLYHVGTNLPRGEHIVLPGSVCAGYIQGHRDACQGDSGGPLTCVKSGRWVLVGVVSWGKGCALPNRPGVYTNVATYSPWIRAHLSL
uniref:Elongin B n=1 Tax=Canis lupus familiaris TaxID=9615 RepID=A0A8C0M3K8_CANLF